MSQPLLLCIGHDRQLLDSRLRVLASRYCVTGAASIEEMIAMASRQLDLVLLCHSLSSEERNLAVLLARKQWPHARLLEICRQDVDRNPDAVDAQIDGLDGPVVLLRSVHDLLAPASDSAPPEMPSRREIWRACSRHTTERRA